MTIGRINADPRDSRIDRVKVTGTVINSVGMLGQGGYQLEDRTGKFTSFPAPECPRAGRA